MSTMPRPRYVWLLAAGVALAAARPAVARADDPKWTPDYAFKVKRVSTVVVSPDGSRVAFVVGRPTTEGEQSEWVSQVRPTPTASASWAGATAGT